MNRVGFENDVKSQQGEAAPGIVSGGDDETETDEPPENQNFAGPFLSSYRRSLPTSSYKRQPKGDFCFGEGELEPLTIEYNGAFIDSMISNDNDWSLPKEAFPLRHEIQNRSPPPEQFPNHSPDLNDDNISIMIEDQPCQLIVTSVPKPTFWDPTHLVEDALRHHANIRDIQTAACVLIALGDRRKDLKIELAVQEHWLLEYLEMLNKFKLWEVATRVSAPMKLGKWLFKHYRHAFLDNTIGVDTFDISAQSTVDNYSRKLLILHESLAKIRLAV